MASLPSTPWLQPPDTAQNFMRGFGLGQQGASEQAQLAQRAAHEQAQLNQHAQQMEQQAQQTQMQLEMKQKEQDRQHLMDQQRLEIQKSYHSQQADIGQQRIKQAQQTLQMKTEDAAKKSAVAMTIQKRVDAGEDRTKVEMEEWPKYYGPQQMAPFVRAAQASAPKNLEMTEQGGESFYRSSPSESYHHVTKLREQPAGSLSQVDRAKLSQLTKDKVQKMKDLSDDRIQRYMGMDLDAIKDPDEKANRKRYAAQGHVLQSQLDAINSQIKELLPDKKAKDIQLAPDDTMDEPPDEEPADTPAAEDWKTVGGFKIRVKK